MDKRIRKIGYDWEIEYAEPGGTMYPQVTLRQRGRELVFPEGVAREVLSFLQEVFPPEAANPTEAVSSLVEPHMREEEQTKDRMQTLTDSSQRQARQAFVTSIRTKSPTLRQVWDWLLAMKIQITPEHALWLLEEHQDRLTRPEGIGGSSVVTLGEYHLTQFLRADLNQRWFSIVAGSQLPNKTEEAAS